MNKLIQLASTYILLKNNVVLADFKSLSAEAILKLKSDQHQLIFEFCENALEKLASYQQFKPTRKTLSKPHTHNPQKITLDINQFINSKQYETIIALHTKLAEIQTKREIQKQIDFTPISQNYMRDFQYSLLAADFTSRFLTSLNNTYLSMHFTAYKNYMKTTFYSQFTTFSAPNLKNSKFPDEKIFLNEALVNGVDIEQIQQFLSKRTNAIGNSEIESILAFISKNYYQTGEIVDFSAVQGIISAKKHIVEQIIQLEILDDLDKAFCELYHAQPAKISLQDEIDLQVEIKAHENAFQAEIQRYFQNKIAEFDHRCQMELDQCGYDVTSQMYFPEIADGNCAEELLKWQQEASSGLLEEEKAFKGIISGRKEVLEQERVRKMEDIKREILQIKGQLLGENISDEQFLQVQRLYMVLEE